MKDKALQEKWEKKLQEAGLGIDQAMTDHSEGELKQAQTKPRKVTNTERSYEQLRAIFDGHDQFMDGFEIKAIRSLDREIPEWALNNKETQRVVLTAFPKLSLIPPKGKTEKKAYRKRIEKAGRWARTIHLYYRMQLPRQIVAKELGISDGALKTLLRNITRVSQGLRAEDGKPRNATPPPTREGTGEKGDETKQSSHLRLSRAGSNGKARTKE